MAAVKIEEFIPLFKSFIKEESFPKALSKFELACAALEIEKEQYDCTVYEKFRLHAGGLTDLWKHLDKLRAQDIYCDGNICKGKKVLIIGAGPCGLRMALECALLGAQVHVVEARNYLSRNNVLHLWPFVIEDIKRIGGKVLFRQFCVGSVDHISIKRLQLLLAKICLLLGVKIYAPVLFEGLKEPDPEQGTGWRADLQPKVLHLSDTDFDFVVGANGKSNCLPDFERNNRNGKLAIAITANFKNRKTTKEACVQEINGYNYLYRRDYFLRIKSEVNAILENIVYFKDETHYFVMTIKSETLLEKGVLKENFPDRKQLLARSNIDNTHLETLAKDIANSAVEGKLPDLEFALNHHKKPDVAVFDFTNLAVAEYSCYAKERHGKVLVQCLVGDSLLEPFWPTGIGAARGFLSVLDAAWLIRRCCLKEKSPLELIAEKEKLFQYLVNILHHRALHHKYNLFSIKPNTRYSSLRLQPDIKLDHIKNLYNARNEQEKYVSQTERRIKSRSSMKRAESMRLKQHERPKSVKTRSKSVEREIGSRLPVHEEEQENSKDTNNSVGGIHSQLDTKVSESKVLCSSENNTNKTISDIKSEGSWELATDKVDKVHVSSIQGHNEKLVAPESKIQGNTDISLQHTQESTIIITNNVNEEIVSQCEPEVMDTNRAVDNEECSRDNVTCYSACEKVNGNTAEIENTQEACYATEEVACAKDLPHSEPSEQVECADSSEQSIQCTSPHAESNDTAENNTKADSKANKLEYLLKYDADLNMSKNALNDITNCIVKVISSNEVAMEDDDLDDYVPQGISLKGIEFFERKVPRPQVIKEAPSGARIDTVEVETEETILENSNAEAMPGSSCDRVEKEETKEETNYSKDKADEKVVEMEADMKDNEGTVTTPEVLHHKSQKKSHSLRQYLRSKLSALEQRLREISTKIEDTDFDSGVIEAISDLENETCNLEAKLLRVTEQLEENCSSA